MIPKNSRFKNTKFQKFVRFRLVARYQYLPDLRYFMNPKISHISRSWQLKKLPVIKNFPNLRKLPNLKKLEDLEKLSDTFLGIPIRIPGIPRNCAKRKEKSKTPIIHEIPLAS